MTLSSGSRGHRKVPWSSSTEYKWTDEPHLTSGTCSRALSDFFLSPVDLAIATEASSHPSGLVSLFGQPYVYAGGGLGNMYECTLQVCLAGGTGRDSMTFASACVPESCDALDLAAEDFVQKLHLASETSADPKLAYEYNVLHERIAELNRFLGTGWTCGEYVVPFKILPFGGAYVVVSALLLGLTIAATLWRRTKKRPFLNEEEFSRYQEEKKEASPPEEAYCEARRIRVLRFLSHFNIYSNARTLFIRKEATACLDGLRVVSILWVILGHLMAIQSSSGGGYSNPREFLPPNGLTTRLVGQLLFGARFAVDTFLFISGFLVVYVICAKVPMLDGQSVGKRYLSKIPGLVLHRLVRILPLYIMTLGFWTQIAPQLGSGPFWYQWDFFLAPCRAFGWTNLLFVNNFYPWDVPNVATCFYHSWYLAVDMQLFIIAPLLVFWYQRHPRAGQVATALLMLVSMLTTLVLAYERKWSVNTFDGAAVARFEIEGYAKPHVRAQVYFAGMLLGMKLQDRKLNLSVNLKTRVVMAVAVVLLTAVTFITVTGAYARRACNFKEWPALDDCGSTWSSEQTFWYAGTSRAIWALGLGVICYLCLQGAGGIVNTLLSLPMWTPLGHLSFGAYLVHPIVIFVHQFGNRQKEPFRLSTFGLDYISVSIVSFSLALLFTLVVELPCANLAKRFLSFRNMERLPPDSDHQLLIHSEPSSTMYGSTTSR